MVNLFVLSLDATVMVNTLEKICIDSTMMYQRKIIHVMVRPPVR